MRLRVMAAEAVTAAITLLGLIPHCVALDARQIIEREVISGVWPSPDGRLVLYGIERANLEENSTTTSLWLKRVDEAQPAQQQIVQGHAFAWLPNSEGLLFADQDENIRSWDVRAGAAQPVVSLSKFRDVFPGAASISVAEIHVAPVTETVAAVVQLTDGVDANPLTGVEVDVTWWAPIDALIPAIVSPRTRTTIVVFNPRTGNISRLVPEEYDITAYGLGGDSTSVAWSPDGKRLAFTAARLQQPGDASQPTSSDLYVVDVETKDLLALTTAGFDQMPRWSPDGHRIAFRTRTKGTDWNYESTIGIVNVSVPIVRSPLPSERLDDPRTQYAGLAGFSQDSRTLYFSAPVRGHLRFVGLNILSGHLSEPATWGLDFGRYSGPAWAKNQDLFVAPGSDFNRWPDLYAWRPRAGSWRKLTSLNAELNAQPYCKVEEIHWPSKDRKWQLQGFLLTPLKSAKSGRLPLLVHVAGGPNMVSAPIILREALGQYPWPIFLQNGYGVFIPNTRGREGFGTAFQHALKTDRSMNRIPATDVISGVEYLIAQGRVDPDRIGITAHSYGGGVAASALTQTTLFRAASIHEAVALSLTASSRYTADEWKISQMEQYGVGSPLERAQWPALVADSPGEHADQITAATLLEFGVRSGIVNEGRQFYQALRYFKVPSEFIVYPRTGHQTTEPKLIEDAYRRNLEWFDYWLKGVASERMLKRYGPPKVSRLN